MILHKWVRKSVRLREMSEIYTIFSPFFVDVTMGQYNIDVSKLEEAFWLIEDYCDALGI